jgi:peptide/nickel transport system permease protein
MSDYFARSFAILALSVPYFFTATLLIVFPPKWGWAPPLTYKAWADGPIDHLYYFFFPALLLGVGLAGAVMRMTRTMMLEVLRQDYIRTAWAKGLRERVVVVRHAMKNAMIPVLTAIGLTVAGLLSGNVVFEYLFNIPGVGNRILIAITERDVPVVQAFVLIIATFVVFVNLAVDLLYGWVDPRIRLS